MICCSSTGTSGANSPSGAGCSNRCLCRSSGSDPPRNKGRRANSTYNTPPRLYKSLRGRPAALRPARRHEFGRPQHAPGGGVLAAAEQPGDAEIGELHLTVGGQQQVARLYVAMDHAAVVGVPQGAGHVGADPRNLTPGEAAAPAQLFLQAAAGNQFHGIEKVLFLFAKAEQANDVRMVELSQRLDFRLEALAEIRIVGQRNRQQLDGRRLAVLRLTPS